MQCIVSNGIVSQYHESIAVEVLCASRLGYELLEIRSFVAGGNQPNQSNQISV